MRVAEPLRVVCYVNQFFAGIGGEEKADTGPGVREGPAGPGLLLERLLAGAGTVVATVYCGDNYMAGHPAEAVAAVVDRIAGFRPDVVVAGPAFNAGRYGPACARVCRAVQERLGVPALTAMAPQNPGVELEGRGLIVVPTGDSAAQMGKVMPKVAELAVKLGRRVPLGPPAVEGYLPRGVRRNEWAPEPGARRAVAMLLEKLAGRPYVSEVPLPRFDRVPPAPPVADVRRATIALVTEGGVVPRGNPDRLEAARASKWLKYPLAGLADLTPATHEVVHGGMDRAPGNADPDRILPLDAMRRLEAEGVVGRLYGYYYVTTGNNTDMAAAARYGREIAADLLAAEVTAVVLPST